MINGQTYDLYVRLGNISFKKAGLIYNKDNQIAETPECEGGDPFKCQYNNVKSV